MPSSGWPRTPPAALISWIARVEASELRWAEEGQGAGLREDRAEHHLAVAGPGALDGNRGDIRRGLGADLLEGCQGVVDEVVGAEGEDAEAGLQRLTVAANSNGPDCPS